MALGAYYILCVYLYSTFIAYDVKGLMECAFERALRISDIPILKDNFSADVLSSICAVFVRVYSATT